jgi:SAM-dependent methyltransferase
VAEYAGIEPALERASRLLREGRDVVEGRVERAVAPVWCTVRRWDGFLGALDDAALAACEARGLAACIQGLPGAPPSLIAFCSEVTEASRLPALVTDGSPAALESDPLLRSVNERKRGQLAALLAACAPLAARASRIVDVGAGRGHLTRMAAQRFARETVGVERDAARAARAAVLADRDGVQGVRFVAMDALAAPLALAWDDLALGLHACGEVGDRLLVEARAAGCDVALVPCCLQKITTASRAPLSSRARTDELVFLRETLGLGNLGPGREGLTAPHVAAAAREARWGLRLLLSARGVEVAPGEEMRGINRRRALRGLHQLAQAALAARGLPPATPQELQRCGDEAARQYALVRRWSLPRGMLGRLVETTIALDRARFLEEHGWDVRVGELFSSSRSPRNIAILGRAPDALREGGRGAGLR